jgi:hypothetical protein
LHGPENVAEIPTVALISKLASSIGITWDELEDLRAKDHIGAFKLLMLSKGTSDKSPSVSTTSSGDLFGNSKDPLIRELLLKVLNVDLFREIEQDPNLIYEIKALLKKPNSLVSSESIVCFILQLDPC